MSSADDWYELLESLSRLPDRERLSAVQQALQDAERARHPLGATILRQGLIDTALHLGRGDLIVQHFPRALVEMSADDPDLQLDILFRYRWAVAAIVEFPQVTLQQVDELLGDMSQRYREAGFSLRGVEVLKMLVGRETGRQPQALAAERAFPALAIDVLSDDEETEQAFVARNHAMFRDAEFSLAEAQRTYLSAHHRVLVGSTLLQILLQQGALKLAEACAQRSRAGVIHDARFARERGEHLLFYGVTGQAELGRRMLGDHFGASWRCFEQMERFWYFRGAGFFLQRTAPLGPLADDCELTIDGQTVRSRDPAQLARWSLDEARQIAERLDQRNGNRHFQQWMDDLPELHALADELNLSG
jgi:hypothetical protein